MKKQQHFKEIFFGKVSNEIKFQKMIYILISNKYYKNKINTIYYRNYRKFIILSPLFNNNNNINFIPSFGWSIELIHKFITNL